MTGAVTLDRDWLLHLASRLQTTLAVEGLIELFALECRERFAFDGLEYVQRELDLAAAYGRIGRHSCSYDITLYEEHLGRLVFSREHPFSEEDTRKLELLTSQLVYPLRNALLYRSALLAASRDPLTGANNRVTLQATLERELSLSRRYHTPLSVLMLDLDFFKRINDQHGHGAGDRALQAVVQRMHECVRGSDILFRYGGEEFLLLLRNTDLEGASLLAERIRQALESLRIVCENAELRLTASLGVALARDDEGWPELLRRVDQALYRAKAAGRNRVETGD